MAALETPRRNLSTDASLVVVWIINLLIVEKPGLGIRPGECVANININSVVFPSCIVFGCGLKCRGCGFVSPYSSALGTVVGIMYTEGWCAQSVCNIW